VLRKNEFYVKMKKCAFWFGKVAFLEYVVSREGISLDPQNIEVIT